MRYKVNITIEVENRLPKSTICNPHDGMTPMQIASGLQEPSYWLNASTAADCLESMALGLRMTAQENLKVICQS